MIVRRYGVELCRIAAGDIELVRRMRNRRDISVYMFEQGHIGKAQQIEWFGRINTFNNYYFLIKVHGKKIGLIYGKDMDFARHECEGGIFIWLDEYMGSDVPGKASICLTEMAFEIFGMRRIYARVRSDNLRAQHYNKALGYIPAAEKGENYIVLTRESYEKRIPFLRRIAAGGQDAAPLSLEDIEIVDHIASPALYGLLPADIYLALQSRFKERESARPAPGK